MPEVNSIKSLISDLGFPIVMCVWLAYMQFTVIKKNTAVIEKFSIVLNQLVGKMSK